jgi:hypothetical protein
MMFLVSPLSAGEPWSSYGRWDDGCYASSTPHRAILGLYARPKELALLQTPAVHTQVRYHYEYLRHTVSALFILDEPLRGWREVVVADQPTAIDWAHVVKHLVDVHYPEAKQIVRVVDNLKTHTPGSPYEAFEPSKPGDLWTDLRSTTRPNARAG